MAYITLEEKLEELADTKPGTPIPLPLEMLSSIAGSTSLAYFLDTAPYTAKDVIDLYSLDNATGFFMEVSRKETGAIKKIFYVLFRDVQYKVYIQLDNIEFFNREKMEADWNLHMEEVQQGDLVICAHPTYLIRNIGDLFEAGFERAKWDETLPEGSYLTILSKFKVDNFWLVKVLYKDKPMWSFGVLFKHEIFENQDNSNHYI